MLSRFLTIIISVWNHAAYRFEIHELSHEGFRLSNRKTLMFAD